MTVAAVACTILVILTPQRAHGVYQAMRIEVRASKGCPARTSHIIRVRGPQKLATDGKRVWAVWAGKEIRVP